MYLNPFILFFFYSSIGSLRPFLKKMAEQQKNEKEENVLRNVISIDIDSLRNVVSIDIDSKTERIEKLQKLKKKYFNNNNNNNNNSSNSSSSSNNRDSFCFITKVLAKESEKKKRRKLP